MIFRIFLFSAVLSLAACGPDASKSRLDAGDVATADATSITGLTRLLIDLGPEVDPSEAARAAQIAVTYSRQLQQDYQVTDPPLLHNFKVNRGLRPRGLCYHWADDLEARLSLENFKTLALHRAIANSTNIRIDHSTTIISRKGDAFDQGVIVDPWRYGGRLFWARVLDDSRYAWIRRDLVFAARRAREGG